LPCPEESDSEISDKTITRTPDLSDYDLAWLPVVSISSPDVITERIYVGKTVLKEMFFND